MENILFPIFWLVVAAVLVLGTAILTYKFVLFTQKLKARNGRNPSLWEASHFERGHFNESTITVDLCGLDPKSLVGVTLTNSEIIALSGATTGSRVSARHMSQQGWDSYGTGVDRPPPGLYFDVSGPLIEGVQTVGVFQGPGGTPGIYLKDIFFKDTAPPGLAGRMLVRMVRMALDLGIPELNLLGAGGRTWPNAIGPRRWGGYLAWAIYGFDMHVLPVTRGLFPYFQEFPLNLSNCYTVQSVVNTEGGRDFWKVVGDGWFMHFDASRPDSESIKSLLKQVKKKGV